MKKRGPKTRFWFILTSLNVVSLVLMSRPLLQSEVEAVRRFGALMLMVGVILLVVADLVSIVFAYWDCIDETM